jgi:hypothetical protein
MRKFALLKPFPFGKTGTHPSYGKKGFTEE